MQQGHCIQKDNFSQKTNALNQLLSTFDTIFKYDKCGNRVKNESNGSKTEYEYDALNRLVKVVCEDFQYMYTYDSFNRRLSKIKKTISGDILQKTDYLYAGQNEIGAVIDGTLVEFRTLGIGKGAEIGAAIAIELKNQVYIPVHDQNGNIVQIKDAAGVVMESYHYSAFGEQTDHSSVHCPWGYASKRIDEETGFIHFGRRYFDTKTARWTSPDPLGFEDGPNLYAYVHNNPVSHFDLYGLFSFSLNFSGNQSGVHLRPNFGLIGMVIGRTIEAFGNHAIPLPAVRGAVMATGGYLAGDGFHLDPKEWRIRQSKGLKPLGAQTAGNHANISINGILNQERGAGETQTFISDSLGGQIVHHIYNASRGLITDLCECALLIAGYETESVRIAACEIKKVLGQVGSGGSIDLYAHSMGGLIASRALEKLNQDQLNQITVYTFGSAKIICNDFLKSATNYISPFDPVPFIADPIGCLIGIFSKNSNVKFLWPRGYPLMDHCFRGGTYEHQFLRLANDSRLKHGTS